MPDRSLNKEKGGIRKTSKKPKATTAFLIGLMIIAFIIPFFIWIKASSASPLGTYIKVCILCDETELPVAAGLRITITAADGSTQSALTGADGCTDWMGTGFTEGTYIISFYWNMQYEYPETIDSTQQEWTFTYEVPNPIIHKTFLYNLVDNPPVVGLEVILKGPALTDSYIGYTNASGMVTFGGDVVKVCTTYTLRWVWNGVVMEDGPIHFAYTDGQLLECEIWLENFLEPKSGGGK